MAARAVVIACTLYLAAGAAFAQDARRDEEPPAEPAKPKLTRPPELIEAAAPEYPEEAAAAGLEAEVTVRIAIDANGDVTDAQVVTPVGHGFDEAAVAAARRYKFRPAELDGKPAPIVVETTIHFVLEEEEERPAPAEPPDGATTPRGEGGVLRGVVKERGTRRKLAGVTVAVEELGRDAVSAADGTFRIDGLPAGAFHLLAVAAGYDRFREAITLREGEETEVTVYVRPKGGSPYETTVEAEREKLEVTRHTVNRRQMTTVPGTFGDPIRVLQNLPGMQRAPYVAGILLIRGANPDDSGVYVDGHEIPLLFHFLGGPSILNPEFLDSLALYPGGFPVRYGRAIGGIVEVETRSTKTDGGIHGAADVDLIDSSLYARAQVRDGVNVAVAGRRSYLDTVLPFLLPEPDEGETLIVVPVYWDYQARLDVDLPGPDRLSFMAFGSSDTLDLLASDEEATFDLNTSVLFHRLRATYTTPLAGKLELQLSASGGWDSFNFSGGERTSADVTERVLGLRERVRGPLREGLRLDAGLDLEQRITRYTLVIPIADDLPVMEGGEGIDLDPELFERSIDMLAVGGWLELAWDLGRLRLIPGARVDAYLLAGEPRLSIDPRVVGRFRLDPKTALKGYVGLFHQNPSPEGFDAQLGNPDLGLEQAIHTGFGVERKITPVISAEAEVYWVDRRDLAVFTDEVIRNPDGTITPIFWKNEAVGYTYGFEALVKHEVTRSFYGWLAYTLQRSLQRRHPDDPWRPTAFDSTHNLAMVGSYRFDSGWELGARWRIVTGRPETPILGSTYDADADAYEPLRGASRSGRRPLFHQLDVRVEKTWTFKTWRIGAYLDVMNLYNAENPEATEWDYRYRESAPVRGVPFFPTFGIRGDF